MSSGDFTDDAPKHEPLFVPRCPSCGKLTDKPFRPFCSKRCADLDLGRWLNGVYAIPAREDDDENELISDEADQH